MNRPRTHSRITSVEPEVRELLTLCRNEPRVAWHLVGKLWRFYLGSLLAADLPGGQRSYCRFVVLGRYRSGSNMVRGSLISHSRIVAFGDVFRTPRGARFGLPFVHESERRRLLFQSDPVAFLEAHVFGPFPSRVQAVGLKLLYGNAPNELWLQVRAALSGSAEVRAIHVKRENVLRAHLSMMQRLRHGRWKNITGTSERLEPIVLTYDECLDAFVKTRAWEQEHDSLFPPERRLDISYEHLCADYRAEARRMTDFLGVEFEAIRPLTHQQTRSPLRASIANYDELSERFRGSPWQQFFNDSDAA